MKKVFLFSILLLIGLAGSQWLPAIIGSSYASVGDLVRIMTMAGLSFIMIRVGYEFDIDKSNLKQYAWDYWIAFTAASFPWIFVTLYFVFVLLPPEVWSDLAAWKETLLAGLFAAPTSAGVLFSMLAAAGLGTTWLFRKARVLAIFDDLSTVMLMIPLKMLMIGVAWQLGMTVLIMVGMIIVAYEFLHKVRIPTSWPWVMFYGAAISGISEMIYQGSKLIDESIPIHIEVILPAFVLGCMMAYPRIKNVDGSLVAGDSHHAHEEINSPHEQRASTIFAAVFMVLVGLSMPMITSSDTGSQAGKVSAKIESTLHGAGAPASEAAADKIGEEQQLGRITSAQPPMSWDEIIMHVLIITLISNIGKMFPAFCYKREAHWRERLALSIGMWPRGEVGAGVLVISVSYGIGGAIVTVAMLSLALNLLLTGVFIFIVRQLTEPLPSYRQAIQEEENLAHPHTPS